MIELITLLFDIKVVLLFIAVYLIYKFGTIKHDLHLRLGQKGPQPLPFLGNLLALSKHGIHKFDVDCIKKYGKIYPTYFGGIKMIMVADEEVLKQMLVKDFKCFTDRMNLGITTKRTEKMLGILQGKDWERVRSLLSPTFTSGKLKKMSLMISESTEILKKRIDEYPENQSINFKEFFGPLTMDIIAKTMFGLQIDCQTNTNNKFVKYGKTISSISLFSPVIASLLIFPELKDIIKKLLFGWEFFGRETMDFFTEVLQRAIAERKNSPEDYNDFLGLMLKARKEIKENNSDKSKTSDTKYLTDQEIMAQSIILLLAGFETTSQTMTFAAYFMAKNPDAQQEVYDEIVNKIGKEGEVTYESIMNMPKLDALFNETLRICPVIARTDRMCVQDTTLVTSENRKIMVKKGDIFSIPIYAIHNDPSIWPDPETFDLHRFDPDIKFSPYSFLPFGVGPRNCLGMRFALLEAKWVFVSLVQKFRFSTCPETLDKIEFKKTMFTLPVKPIILKVNKRF